MELEKKYNHTEVEKNKYERWKEYFKCNLESEAMHGM